MDQLIIVIAKYALFVVALGAVVVWLQVNRRDKVALAVQAVIAMLMVAVLVKVAGAVHTDPRPFVSNPGLKPLFPHPADNGFPSDHTALATAIAALITVYRRRVGVALLVVSVLIGVTRVAAHVHHLQDIAAGLLIGIAAAVFALLVWRRLGSAIWRSRI